MQHELLRSLFLFSGRNRGIEKSVLDGAGPAAADSISNQRKDGAIPISVTNKDRTHMTEFNELQENSYCYWMIFLGSGRRSLSISENAQGTVACKTEGLWYKIDFMKGFPARS